MRPEILILCLTPAPAAYTAEDLAAGSFGSASQPHMHPALGTSRRLALIPPRMLRAVDIQVSD